MIRLESLFKPGGYAVADLQLNWRPSERISLGVGLFNLTDVRTMNGRRSAAAARPIHCCLSTRSPAGTSP